MYRQVRRRHQTSFWEEFAEYLIGEITEVLKILGIMLLVFYLFASMLVGMYQMTIYLFWLLWSSL